MPNFLSYAVLGFWPLVTIYFFVTKEIRKAILFSLIGAYMFLPVAVKFDLPGLPDLGKFDIAILSIFFCIFILKKQKIGFFRIKGIAKILIIMMIVSPFLTAMTNKETIGFLQGMTMYDGLSSVFAKLIFMSPFFLGRRFFSQKEDQIFLFKYFAIATLLYSIFILYEIRMSPQLHTTLYGFFPHSFLQQVRGSGFRAVVFMGHGLWVAFFVALGVISTAILWRLRIRIISLQTGIVLLYPIIVLVLSKTLASTLYALSVIVALMFFSPKMQARIALIVAVVILSYPLLNIERLFPHQAVLDIASAIGGKDREESLSFRFRNEKILLDHAYEKSLFGWGGWGRNRVYNDVGKDIVVTDGKWIVIFGTFGWFGLIAEFGLIFITIFLTVRVLKNTRNSQEQFLLSSHALLVTIILVDQIPNSSLNPFYWLLIGSLYGRTESLKKDYNND